MRGEVKTAVCVDCTRSDEVINACRKADAQTGDAQMQFPTKKKGRQRAHARIAEQKRKMGKAGKQGCINE